MGLYDRGYVRDPYEHEGSFQGWAMGKPMVTLIVIFTVGVYLVDFFTGFRVLNNNLALYASNWREPWLWFQYLTYGFIHDPRSMQHILFNMLGLFFLGSAVEQQIGRSEFLKFYLAAIVIGGIVFSIVHLGGNAIALGASGGVEAVVMLFILRNPQATLMLSFIIPVKAWMVGVLLIATNLFTSQEGTAVDIHLAGIAFATVYHFYRWNLSSLSWDFFRERIRLRKREKVRATLRVHDPEENYSSESEEADRILDKIHQQGEASLTAAERRTLENYSRKMRERRGL